MYRMMKNERKKLFGVVVVVFVVKETHSRGSPRSETMAALIPAKDGVGVDDCEMGFCSEITAAPRKIGSTVPSQRRITAAGKEGRRAITLQSTPRARKRVCVSLNESRTNNSIFCRKGTGTSNKFPIISGSNRIGPPRPS